MPNTTPDDWDITSPADDEPLRDGAREVRVLREGLGDRLDREHEELAAAGAGGEHKAGSAKAYFDDADPTNRPDAATPLDADDAGRLFVNTLDGANQIQVWDGTAWIDVKAVSIDGPLPDSYFDFTGVGNGTNDESNATGYSAEVALTFVARRVTIFKNDGSAGWGGTFILPATPLETAVRLRVMRGTDTSRVFILRRKNVDGLTLQLKYTGGSITEFNGTWNAFAAGAAS